MATFVLGLHSVAALAADASAANPYDLGASIGTAGASAQFSMDVVPQTLSARLVVNKFEYRHDTHSDDADYNGKLKLSTQLLLLDWMPFSGGLHLSAGAVLNQNSLRLEGKPSGESGTYEIGGQTYTSAQVGTLTARVDFRKVAPYLGLGWGNGSPGPGLHFIGDVGVVFQGKARARVTDTGGSVRTADLQKEQSDLQAKLDPFRWYPVVQLGMGYRF